MSDDAMPGQKKSRPVLIFDSGIGGLSVMRHVRAQEPQLDLVYVADHAGFSYSDWEEAALVGHVVELMGELIARHDPRAVVIACNTASTLVLPALREQFRVPFVGTVPAIKPAAAATRSGLVSVLATPGTVRRDYTFELIRQFAPQIAITLVGAQGLSHLAELALAGEPVSDGDVMREIAPVFVDRDGVRTDTVVLACTHYPFLQAAFERIAPWPVSWIDPAPAIARRLSTLIMDGPQGRGSTVYFSTRPPATFPSCFDAEGRWEQA
ncbi:glutamate racemase [Breoghania sp.]|uniref:glutamate racemase n=1 Tax=Breoghania sp. TaxID=2065378 RepID=UPI002AAB5056|nr:glutamate racemase [Breoghania sp.]